jgi:mitochondrial fission protein ELM1
MKRALIVSDGKPGHFNQSMALCRHLGLEYEIVEVAYKNRAAKALSYLLDRLGIYTEQILQLSANSSELEADVVVSTGSTTYYANKLLARKLSLPNIAILYPGGYRLDFDHILCPAYDHPPGRENIILLPLNLCAAEPAFFEEKASEFTSRHAQRRPAVGFIIGGPNAVSVIDPARLQNQLEQLFRLTEGLERWVTTSRRTPKEIEVIIESMPFDYTLINSRDPYNPIPAFIQLCERLVVTSDSASMISECASFGAAKVDVLMNRPLKSPNKFEELIGGLAERGALHVFDGALGHADTKIDLGPTLSAIKKS